MYYFMIIITTQIKTIMKIMKGEKKWKKEVRGGVGTLISPYFILKSQSIQSETDKS